MAETADVVVRIGSVTFGAFTDDRKKTVYFLFFQTDAVILKNQRTIFIEVYVDSSGIIFVDIS